MTGRILRDDIDLLRARADIVAVVADHTRLQRAGARMKGLCPFHSEKTPSFTIDPQANLYHCFGCGVGGDVFDFVMRLEGLTFTETVERLARRFGITLRYEELSAGQKRALGERSRLVEVTGAALTFFRERLYADEGAPARDYLKARGFGRDDAERFELGFAPLAWDALARGLLGDGHDRRDVVAAGLAVEQSGGRLRDRFRGRLIFPVRDPAGDVIGFGGRVVPGLDYGDFEPPKYYNSPETPLYKKTRVLFGLDRARADIVRADEAIVCEGYTDVMALHQAGIGTAVATCGTAVGREHLRLLGRYASRIILAFDADAAGAGAARRAFDEALALAADDGGAPADLRVLPLPDGADPADLVAREGADTVRRLVAEAAPVVPFLLRAVIAGRDLVSERDRAETLREALTLLGREPDADLRRAWARDEISAPLGVSIQFVERTADRLGVDLDTHVGAAAPELRPDDRGGVARLDLRRAALERAVLRAALQRPDLLPDEWYELGPGAFAHPRARLVFEILRAAGGAGVAVEHVLEAAPDDEARTLLRAIALEDHPGGLSEEAVADLVRRLVAETLGQEIDGLRERLGRLHPDSNREDWLALRERLAALQRRRHELASVGGR